MVLAKPNLPTQVNSLIQWHAIHRKRLGHTRKNAAYRAHCLPLHTTRTRHGLLPYCQAAPDQIRKWHTTRSCQISTLKACCKLCLQDKAKNFWELSYRLALPSSASRHSPPAPPSIDITQYPKCPVRGQGCAAAAQWRGTACQKLRGSLTCPGSAAPAPQPPPALRASARRAAPPHALLRLVLPLCCRASLACAAQPTYS